MVVVAQNMSLLEVVLEVAALEKQSIEMQADDSQGLIQVSGIGTAGEDEWKVVSPNKIGRQAEIMLKGWSYLNTLSVLCFRE